MLQDWAARPWNKDIFSETGQRDYVVRDLLGNLVCWMNRDSIEQRQVSHAELIAQAPELYLALNTACWALAVFLAVADDGDKVTPEFLDIIRNLHAEWLKVLAKARGENV